MKYGKRLRDEVESTFPEWKGQFMSYKELKKQLKLINPWSRSKKNPVSSRAGVGAGGILDVNYRRETVGFIRLLDSELDKVMGFYFDKEEDYVIRLKELQLRATNLNSCRQKLEVQQDIIDFHREMVLLLHYSVLNFTGLIKIVKKHNKRTGTSFQFSSMARVMQQPNFSTDLLHKLMKECEEMLDRLLLPDDN